MTLEEAKRLLDVKTSGDAIAEAVYWHGLEGKDAAITGIKEACELVCEAIDKQIAKKPEIKIKGTTGYNTKNCCPICGELILKSENYCPRCGQALDWREEK